MIGPIITKIVLVLIGGILLIAGFAFVLVTIYHALAPEHFTPAGGGRAHRHRAPGGG